MQAQPPELIRQEAAIQDLLGIAQAGTFLLASAVSDEELLQLEEAVRVRLDESIAAGALGSYQAVSSWVPSLARQEQSHAAYMNLLHARLPGYFDTLGVNPGVAETTLEELDSAPILELKDWRAHPVVVVRKRT